MTLLQRLKLVWRSFRERPTIVSLTQTVVTGPDLGAKTDKDLLLQRGIHKKLSAARNSINSLSIWWSAPTM
jgi:hypothetical protein